MRMSLTGAMRLHARSLHAYGRRAVALAIVAASFGGGLAAGADTAPSVASLRKHVTIVVPSGWNPMSDKDIADANRDLKGESVLVYGAVRAKDGEAMYVLASDPGNTASSDATAAVSALKEGKARLLEAVYDRANPDDSMTDARLERFCGSDGYSASHYLKSSKSWMTQYTVKVPGMPMMIAQANGAKADADVRRVLGSLCVKTP